MDPRTLRDFPNEKLHAQIKDLERGLSEAAQAISALDARAQPLRAEVSRLTTHLNAIRNEIDRRNRPAPVPRISDHALLRYIERAHDVDLDALREMILTPNIIAAIQAGASGVAVNNVKFVVQGFTIVTVLGEDQRLKRKDGKRGRVVDAGAVIAEGLADYEEEKAAALNGSAL